MSTIPIPCNDDTLKDPFYRYKRSELKIDKCSNYLKLDNLDQIAKQLKVDQKIIISNIKKYLNCNITIVNNKVCIKGKSEDDIDNMLEKFIVEKVICPNCNYPELELNPESDNYNSCNSCGHCINKKEDNNEKLTKDNSTKDNSTKDNSTKDNSTKDNSTKVKTKSISKKDSKIMAREERQKQIENARKAKKEKEESDDSE